MTGLAVDGATLDIATVANVSAVAQSSGSRLWRWHIRGCGAGLLRVMCIEDRVTSPPVVVDDVVLVGHSQAVTAIESRTGRTLWTQPATPSDVRWVVPSPGGIYFSGDGLLQLG